MPSMLFKLARKPTVTEILKRLAPWQVSADLDNPNRTAPALPIALGISICYAVLTFPWVYWIGAGEPDAFAAVVATKQALLSGQGLGGEWLYMRIGQPLYYCLALAIPAAHKLPGNGFFVILNILSWTATAATLGLLYSAFRSFASPTSAMAGTMAVAASQTVFSLALYTHPITLAILAWAGGLYFATRVAYASRGVAFAAACAGTLAIAATLRADVLVLFPAAAIVAWISAKRAGRQTVMLSLSAVAIGGLLGLFLLSLLNHLASGSASSGQPLSTMTRLLTLLKHFDSGMSPFVVLNGVAEIIINAGPATVAIFAVAAVTALWRRQRKMLVIVLLLMLPPFYVAAVNPAGSRRWIQTVYALAVSIVLLLPGLPRLRPRTLGTLFAAFMLGNFAVFPLGARLIPNAQAILARHTVLARLSRSVIAHRNSNMKYLRWQASVVPGLVSDIQTRQTLVVGGFGHLYMILEEMSRRGEVASHEIVSTGTFMFLTQVHCSQFEFWHLEWTRETRTAFPSGPWSQIIYLANYAEIGTAMPNGRVLQPPDSATYSMW